MTDYGLWKFVHILLLVYWLGADLGVFILARAVRNASLSFEQRALLLKYAMVIDFLPRICFALMLPSGLHLTAASGYADVPMAAFIFAWVLAAAWLWLLFALGRAEGTPRQAELGKVNLAGQAAVGIIIIGAGLGLLLGFGPAVTTWLALKVLLFGLIFPCAIMIDVEFRPIGPAFGRLATEGSTPEVEAIITRTVDRAVWWVLAIYALVVAITFLGAVQPG